MEFDPLLHKLRVPIETINILGCGGLRMGTITECWGTPGGGKSTFCYQTGAYFQQDYPGGFLHLLDAENSYDDIRLEHVFGIDIRSPNFIVEPAPTIEDFTEKVLKGMQKAKAANKPYLAIVDSWTVLNTTATIENIAEALKNEKVDLNMNAGAMMAKPKSTRHWLNAIMPFQYQAPFSILIINQASTSMNKYGASVSSAGGYGLKHDMQYSLSFMKKETVQEGDIKLGFTNTTEVQSEVNITKSKFMPDFAGIPVTIDVAGGGKILPVRELISLGIAKGIVSKDSPGWYKVPGSDKKYRQSDLEEVPGLADSIKKEMTDKFRKDYFLVNIYYQEKEKRLNAPFNRF